MSVLAYLGMPGLIEILIILVVLLAMLLVVVMVLASALRKPKPGPNLYPCPDCGRMVSRLAPTCPSCGRPLTPSAEQRSK